MKFLKMNFTVAHVRNTGRKRVTVAFQLQRVYVRVAKATKLPSYSFLPDDPLRSLFISYLIFFNHFLLTNLMRSLVQYELPFFFNPHFWIFYVFSTLLLCTQITYRVASTSTVASLYNKNWRPIIEKDAKDKMVA